MVNFFVHFAEVIFGCYKYKMEYWMAFNETNNQRNRRVPLFDYCCSGMVYAERENSEETVYRVLCHQSVASTLVAKAAHRISPDIQAGRTLTMVVLYSYSCEPEDVMFAWESICERCVFIDIQLCGYYPSYVLNG